jgi:hypothetical protein
MHIDLAAACSSPYKPDYAISGTVDSETGRVELIAEPNREEAARYTISGSIDLHSGDIGIVATANHVGATNYTISGYLDLRTGQLCYVHAEPSSSQRPKFDLSGSLDLSTGRIAITAESRRSDHPNYEIRGSVSQFSWGCSQ